MVESFSWLLVILGAIIVVGLTEYIKGINKKNLFPKLQRAFPLIFACFSGVIITFVSGFNVWRLILNSFVVLAISVIAYESILKYVKNAVEKVKVDIENKRK